MVSTFQKSLVNMQVFLSMAVAYSHAIDIAGKLSYGQRLIRVIFTSCSAISTRRNGDICKLPNFGLDFCIMCEISHKIWKIEMAGLQCTLSILISELCEWNIHITWKNQDLSISGNRFKNKQDQDIKVCLISGYWWKKTRVVHQILGLYLSEISEDKIFGIQFKIRRNDWMVCMISYFWGKFRQFL